MKNVIIVVLVLALGVTGYLLYSNEKSPNNPATSGSNEVSTETTTGDEINLSNKNLDKVSQDILDNRSVTKLDVSDNNLTGSLPAEIRKLTNLEVLIASGNKMTGIPAEIGQLSKLRIANFANNDLSGLPQEIGKLRNLETFDLRGNPNISQNDIAIIQKQIPNAKILTD
jgi:Leucine-rich repeat (LRR) protein